MMCFTFSTSTAYCNTDRQLQSVCTTTLATLRCTKISPGIKPTISLAGTRESEQPIHKYSGDCCSDNFWKKSGWIFLIDSAQLRLFSNRFGNSFMTVYPVSFDHVPVVILQQFAVHAALRY